MKEEKIIKEIIYLSSFLSLEDWKKIRNNMFPNYYNEKNLIGSNNIKWKERKINYIKKYLNNN